MKRLWMIWPLALAFSAAVQAKQQPSQTGTQSLGSQSSPSASTNSDKMAPKRVRADLSGFELAPKKSPATSGSQIGGGTRGGLTGPRLYAPHRANCFTTNPTFHWEDRNGQNTFKLTVYDSDDHVVYETTVHGDNLTYPSDAMPLRPGRTYSWAVQTSGSFLAEVAGPAEPAELVLLSPHERLPIQDVLRSITGESLQDQLRRAEVFVDARLWYDAVAKYSELIVEYPNRADLYEKRGEIYDQIPETHGLADQDFARGEKLQAPAAKSE